MFDTVVLGRSCSKKDYSVLAPKLRMQLFEAQRACREHKIPMLILVNGVDGSGRGKIMNLLSDWMDGKFLRNYVFWNETDEQREHPLEWRFWQCLPGKGDMHVFFDGWYGGFMRQRCTGELSEQEFINRMNQFKGLEESLAMSGMAIVKIWLHLDKKTHDTYLKERKENKVQTLFTTYDQKAVGKYKELVQVAGDAITMTDRTYAPWHIIDAADTNYRNLSVASVIIHAANAALRIKNAMDIGLKEAMAQDPSLAAFLAKPGDPLAMALPEQETEIKKDEPLVVLPDSVEQEALVAQKEAGTAEADGKTQEESPLRKAYARGIPLTSLEVMDLTPTIDPAEYKKQLKALQNEIHQLTFQTYKRNISSTLIFEGMDAAGKGGTIRRLMAGVDCRTARVIPISSPTDEELAHHYLWRFWRHIPRYGQITIYDRSWYGRVLVERVEELTSPTDWRRAYEEINHFERSLTQNNNILLKFWLQISPEEELRRFKERENTPWKNYKITEDDWRNRAKWDQYLVAADEMFQRTNTSYAPWHLISAEDKKYARIAVLTKWRDALKKALEKA